MTRLERQAHHQTIKTLIVAYGPREAARQAGLSENTVLAIARRNKWKQAGPQFSKPGRKPEGNLYNQFHTQSPADALAKSLNGHKSRSIFALGKWTAEAAEQAAAANDKLQIAGRVRDVAGVHSVLWPTEAKAGLLRVGILIGTEAVTDINVQSPCDNVTQQGQIGPIIDATEA